MSVSGIENLVFEGGGSLGMAYVGVLAALEDMGIVSNVKRVAGSSAGSIIAMCIVLGYTSEELREIMASTNFSSFQDDTFGIIRDANRIWNEYGLCKGKKMKKWIRSLIKRKVGVSEITFHELYSIRSIELVMTATNISRKRTEYYSVFRTPTMDVATVVSMSTCIPILYRAIKMNDDLYVDGGMLRNYPLSVFDDEDGANMSTIGFKLVGPDESRNDRIVTERSNIDSFPSFVSELIELLLLEVERGVAMTTKKYWERTVTIPTNGLSGTNFELTKDEMDVLYADGLKETHRFFSEKKLGPAI